MDSSPQERNALLEAHALKLLQNLGADRAGVADVSGVVEDLLVQRLGATGPGFRAKLKLVEQQLHEPLRRDLHYLATVRNDILHSALSEIRDPARFVRTAKRSIHALLAIEAPAPTKPAASGNASAQSSPGNTGGSRSAAPAEVDALAMMKDQLRQKKAFRLAVVFAIAAVAIPVTLLKGGSGYLPFALVFPVIAMVNILLQTFLSQSQYRNLPGSTDTRGEHRCLQCGHRGIHRSTIYQTNTTVARCSKCGLKMWAE
jgi:predicted RNA-binding Zn-ribbon protein involved in translation (DUF1610 family)